MDTMKRNQTYHRLDYHIVFSTKNRDPLLDDDLILHLIELVRQKAIEIDFILHILNGAKDHVHLLLSLPPKYSVSHIVKHIKGFTSHEISHLYWQDGYSAFTVDRESFNRVFQYIFNQKSHHSEMDFETEINKLILET